MKNLKFKAWHKERKKMYEVNIIGLQNTLISVFDKEVGFYWYDYFVEIELLQFTGLTDKNGVEIYPDYILYDKEHNKKYRVYAVAGGFAIKAGYWSHDMKDINISQGDELVLCSFAEPQTQNYIKDYCEVIGNIYENPELLEVKND